jgi:hypothetical protein
MRRILTRRIPHHFRKHVHWDMEWYRRTLVDFVFSGFSLSILLLFPQRRFHLMVISSSGLERTYSFVHQKSKSACLVEFYLNKLASYWIIILSYWPNFLTTMICQFQRSSTLSCHIASVHSMSNFSSTPSQIFKFSFSVTRHCSLLGYLSLKWTPL